MMRHRYLGFELGNQIIAVEISLRLPGILAFVISLPAHQEVGSATHSFVSNDGFHLKDSRFLLGFELNNRTLVYDGIL